MTAAKFEIQVAAVPRTYRDDIATAISAGRELKHRNRNEEIKIIDLETRRWAMITDGVNEPAWHDPGWEPRSKPL